jgi:membrane-bound lytic murein transglycosylase C
MKKIFLSSLFTLLLANNYSYNNFQKEYLQGYKQYKNDINKQFQDFNNSLNKEFQAYKKELSKYWAKPELSSKDVFVEYSKDLKTKRKVDFQNNYMQIAVLAKNKKEAELKMARSIKKLSTETVSEAFNDNPVLKKVEKKFKNVGVSAKLKNKPIIADVVFKKPPTQKRIINYIKTSIQQHPIKVKKSKIPALKQYILTVPLPKNTHLIKAREYKSTVFYRAKEFHLPASLIYAIIQTESSFNPMARSYVPAFGLMQIVPQTAGKDAYKYLYNKPRLLTPSYLYNGENNIKIGSAYLNLLYYKYFKKVKDPISRMYLTIAAYNTGAGNIACAFNSTRKDFRGRTMCYRFKGDYNINKAVPKINSMSSKQVYNHLLSNLRYDEAKNYLKRVSKRLYRYQKAINNHQI